MNKKAILVVSFGSSYKDTREKTINKIEKDIEAAYPDYKVYRAFSSLGILQRLKANEELYVCSVKEALNEIIDEGIEELIVQPTYIINGKENHRMLELLTEHKRYFDKVYVGSPLLNTIEDYQKVVQAFVKELPEMQEDEAVVCMGHGTEHFMSISYAAMDYMFKDAGFEGIYVATLEAYPNITSVMKLLAKKQYKKVKIVPFMLAAGHHVKKDMVEKAEASWKSKLEKSGYEVSCTLKGLGEYEAIRALYVEHVKEAEELK